MSKTDNAGSSAAACHAETAALPLNAVRVFVEAARAGSLSGAARRLGMTQSGVSHHVATLEKHLSGIVNMITDDGQTFTANFNEEFRGRIRDSWKYLKTEKARAVLEKKEVAP